MLSRSVAALATTISSEVPWWTGVPTKLLRKQAVVVGNNQNRLPVYTLTFAMPSQDTKFTGPAMHHSNVSMETGDVVKMVIPDYKPKSYSMSAKRENEFDITFKVYPNGRASGHLNRLQVGDEMNSFGKSVKRHRNPGSYVGIISYGVGITEALPVATAELENGDTTNVVLLLASRTMDDTFWHEEIASLEAKYPDKFKMIHILSREEDEGCLHGHINTDVIDQVFRPENKDDARFLSVGTKEMKSLTDEMLAQAGYDMPRHALLPKQ